MDERAARVLEAAGAECAVLTSPAAVAYATGFAPFAGAGPSPFDAGPPVAVVSADGVVLVVADADAGVPVHAGVKLRAYGAFDPGPEAPRDAYAAAVRAAIDGRSCATEPDLTEARLTKTASEVAALRRAAELASEGQRAARAALAPGRTELAVYADARAAMEALAGEPLALGADLLSGERTLEVMGPPGNRAIVDGDPVLCDLVPRRGAYWGDSSTTPVAGDPRPAFARLHRTALDALELAVETARPGVRAGELDAAVRGVIERAGYVDPIHVGHGIGVSNVEPPRIVPGAPERLRAGMVLMLEPTAVDPGVAAVRLEWMVVLTEDGAEVLSTHEVGL
jgi:Xaa-Pro aminopeptidase